MVGWLHGSLLLHWEGPEKDGNCDGTTPVYISRTRMSFPLENISRCCSLSRWNKTFPCKMSVPAIVPVGLVRSKENKFHLQWLTLTAAQNQPFPAHTQSLERLLWCKTFPLFWFQLLQTESFQHFLYDGHHTFPSCPGQHSPLTLTPGMEPELPAPRYGQGFTLILGFELLNLSAGGQSLPPEVFCVGMWRARSSGVSLGKLGGGTKRSNCLEHSKPALIPSWALQNSCQQLLVAAQSIQPRQSRFNGLASAVLRSLQPEVRGGSWKGVTLPWWQPNCAVTPRSARFHTKQGVFMKLLSSWKTKWGKKKKGDDYTTLLALLLPSSLNKSIYSIIKIFCCLLVETGAFSLQTHNSHSIFNNAQSFTTCSRVSAVRARDMRNEMCWIHSRLSSFYWI